MSEAHKLIVGNWKMHGSRAANAELLAGIVGARPYAADVAVCLQPSGKLHFWTDVKDYYDAAVALIAEATPLVGPLDQNRVHRASAESTRRVSRSVRPVPVANDCLCHAAGIT